MSNKKLIKGAFILAFAGLMAKALGIFFKIPLQRLIGDEGMGLFGLPYPLYTVMLAISITGFPAAVSKLISERLTAQDIPGVNKIFRVSFIMLFCIGLFSSAFLYFGANHIIDFLDWPKDAYYSIVGLSLAPFFVSIMSAFRGYFQGMQLMAPTAVSQIIEQIGRVVIGVGLSYLLIPKGIGYAAGAASFGASAGAFLGTLALTIYYGIFKRKKRYNYNPIDLLDNNKGDSAFYIMKQIIWFAIPISIGGILSSIMTLVDAVMVPSRLLQGGYTVEGVTILYGQLTGKAVTLMNVPLTFSAAMAASLIPSIAESYSKKNVYDLQEKARSALNLTIFIALPASIGLSILAPQIIHLLWGKGEAGGHILRVMALNVIFASLAQVLSSILHGMDKAYAPLKNLMIGIIIKVVISYYLLVTKLNILGAVIGSIVGYMVVMILNYIEVKKFTGLDIEIKDSLIKPLTSSILMTIMVYLSYSWIYLRFSNENLATIGSITAAILIYFSSIYLFQPIEKTKVKWF